MKVKATRQQKPTIDSVPSTPVERSRVGHIINMGLGDLIAFLIVGVIGLNSHGETLEPANLLRVTWPVALAWFVLSPFFGVFRRDLASKPGRMATRTALAWLVACVGALLLRSVFETQKPPPVSFAIVTLLTNLVALFIWRLPMAKHNQNKLAKAQEQQA
ncbi:DUF3054 domain-containing protein [Ktedonospora formicarum]|uniref:DUF3054 domain-containing protein n=1 Tax=Ktedonospora formicarum TaxID=2778364 RepID=A0A8J3HTI1_9CHLR|nr:DUF3054 domain-containing protein [Ktedonospora formicarum]GHO43697.1 hypothetical protein KSX_18600 [Ktedonospora formicarum]